MWKVLTSIVLVVAASVAQAQEHQAEIGCDPYAQTHRSPVFGAGGEVAFGRQHGTEALNHLAFLFGAVWDLHLTSSFGFGGHVDLLFGGEQGIDSDGDRRDDVSTGDRRSFLTTAGPRLRFGLDNGTALGLSAGAGYLIEIADGPNGGVVDVGLAFGKAQQGRIELGLRYIGGFGDTRDTQMALVTGTLSSAGAPDVTFSGGCPGFESGGSRVPYGFGLQGYFVGVNMTRDAAAVLPGIGVRFFVQLHEHIDVFAETDLIALKGVGADPITLLRVGGGLRVQYGHISADLSAGYGRAHGTQPHEPGSGATLSAEVAYDFANTRKEGFYVLLGGRAGVSRDNRDLRLLWLGLRAEFRSEAYAR